MDEKRLAAVVQNYGRLSPDILEPLLDLLEQSLCFHGRGGSRAVTDATSIAHLSPTGKVGERSGQRTGRHGFPYTPGPKVMLSRRR